MSKLVRAKKNGRGVVGCPPQKLAESILPLQKAVCSEAGVVVTRAGDNINPTLSSPTELGGMCAVLNHPPAGAGEIRRSQKPPISKTGLAPAAPAQSPRPDPRSRKRPATPAPRRTTASVTFIKLKTGAVC